MTTVVAAMITDGLQIMRIVYQYLLCIPYAYSLSVSTPYSIWSTE